MYRQIVQITLLKVILLSCLVNISYSECPQVPFDSLLVSFCDSKNKCIDRVQVLQCVGPEMVLDDTVFLEIFSELHVLRRGFIHDLPELQRLFAFANNISRIFPGAFLNVPKLNEVRFGDSTIREIMWGVFNNMPISFLELHWNYISFIEKEAFSNMPNLKFLDLADNRLKTFENNWLRNSTNLETLHLNNNQLERISRDAFSDLPKLKHVDLSFNKIKQLDYMIFYDATKLDYLDLTSNDLVHIPKYMFGDETEVGELKVSLNYLTVLDVEMLERAKVKSIMLHPNPWQCSCLENVLDWMRDHNTTLIDVRSYYRLFYHANVPDCVFSQLHEDDCGRASPEDFDLGRRTYLDTVNYTSWHYVTKSRFKPECECESDITTPTKVKY